MEKYSGLSSIYDKMIEIDYNKWIEFISALFKNKNISLRNKEALELGCGTGNMTAKLIDIPMKISALDISTDMLTLADEKIRKKGHNIILLNQDMVDFEINKTYDFIFSFCDGYNYIDSDNILKSFENVCKHLNKGGYFVFDLSTKYKLKEKIGNNTFTLVEDDICYIWDNYYENDILNMYITFFVKEKNMYRRFEEEHILNAYDTNFIMQALTKTGFDEIELYDDYTFLNPLENSLRTTFVCKVC